MPKTPKYEDWTPPWGEDDAAFDAEKAKKLIYNLHVDKDNLTEKVAERDTSIKELQGKVDEYETKDLSEVDRLKRENEQLRNAKPSGDDLAAVRLEIALDKGLTKAQAARLIGDSREALEADADAYIEEHGLNKDGSSGESSGSRPPSRRPAGNLKTGSERDDAEQDEVLDPAKLQENMHRSRF